ncbi:hypothetical protein TWF694_009278 [Orbilia ellipsospora]|uniref:Uncharacterized protein n=1 Tax=Orbilia ellipsospora TaxID=2528407 RepID=A0AAV9XEF6_9PEZI
MMKPIFLISIAALLLSKCTLALPTSMPISEQPELFKRTSCQLGKALISDGGDAACSASPETFMVDIATQIPSVSATEDEIRIYLENPSVLFESNSVRLDMP